MKNNIIGDKIRILRKNREWTQAKLAELLNMSEDAIQKWEVGKNEVVPECLKQLGDVFGVKPSIFIDEDAHVIEYLLLYKTKDGEFAPDSAHAVYDANLRKGAKLHRFINPAGDPYSGIYIGSREIYSCIREHESQMVKYWNDEEVGTIS